MSQALIGDFAAEDITDSGMLANQVQGSDFTATMSEGSNGVTKAYTKGNDDGLKYVSLNDQNSYFLEFR